LERIDETIEHGDFQYEAGEKWKQKHHHLVRAGIRLELVVEPGAVVRRELQTGHDNAVCEQRHIEGVHDAQIPTSEHHGY
jgi:hypothetical protein